MANEISFNFGFTVQNPAQPAAGQIPFTDPTTLQLSLTQNAQGASSGAESFPTTAGGTLLPVGGVTTQGWLILANLDTVNYVQWGIQVAATFHAVGKLKAGEACIVRIDPGATIYILANTAPVEVEYKLYQD